MIQGPVVKADDILNKSSLITSTRVCSIFSWSRFYSIRQDFIDSSLSILSLNHNTRHTHTHTHTHTHNKILYNEQSSISFNIKFHYYYITWTH